MISALENNSLKGSKSYGGAVALSFSRLWKGVKCGFMELENRVVMCPLTRYRAIGHLPNPLLVEYYGQRASKGSLLISEGTFISKEAGGNTYLVLIPLTKVSRLYVSMHQAFIQQSK